MNPEVRSQMVHENAQINRWQGSHDTNNKQRIKIGGRTNGI